MNTAERARHLEPRAGTSIWVAGDLITFKLVGDDTGGTFTLAEDATPPGGGPPPHVHRHEDETFCILEGEYEIMLGDRTVRTGPGSVVYAPRNVPHTFRNVGSEPAKMLSFVTPSGLEAFLQEVGEPAREGASPPPLDQEQVDRIESTAPKYGMEMLPSGR